MAPVCTIEVFQHGKGAFCGCLSRPIWEVAQQRGRILRSHDGGVDNGRPRRENASIASRSCCIEAIAEYRDGLPAQHRNTGGVEARPRSLESKRHIRRVWSSREGGIDVDDG
eukprot:1252711-Rhodomonas_salina.1